MVLLASMDVARPCEHFEVVEMFAGSARVSRLAKGLGKHAVALDKSIDGSMDLNTDAGFLLLACKHHTFSSAPSITLKAWYVY